MASNLDIKAAVELMDVAADAQWNKDGTPKLDVVRENLKDQTVSKESLLAAIGEWRRPAAPVTPSEADIAAAAAAALAGGDRPDETTPEPEPDEESPTDKLLKQVAEWRAARAEFDVQIAEQEKIKSAADRKVHQIRVEQDKVITLIERFAPQVSQAEAVKRVQAQTRENLQRNILATSVVAAAMKQTGLQSYPSKLDQTLATRRRTPEQQANYAKFVHQTAAGISAARG